jgi:hypothetical protein
VVAPPPPPVPGVPLPAAPLVEPPTLPPLPEPAAPDVEPPVPGVLDPPLPVVPLAPAVPVPEPPAPGEPPPVPLLQPHANSAPAKIARPSFVLPTSASGRKNGLAKGRFACDLVNSRNRAL